MRREGGGALRFALVGPTLLLLAAFNVFPLAYNVFLTRVSPSTIWGDGTGGSVPATGSITVNRATPRKPLSIPMIGVIPAGQTVGAGVYSDTLTVTITWN